MRCNNFGLTGLTIVYCGNDKMFDGLYLSILSIVRRTKAKINFFLLTGDLTEYKEDYYSLTNKHEQIIRDLIVKHNSESTFDIVDCAKNFKDKINGRVVNLNHWTPYTLFRLFICELGFVGKVLYLDGDILINGDISEAFNENIENHELCAVHGVMALKKKNHWFNAGVLLINTEIVSQTNLLSKAFEYCIKNKPAYMDEDALNILVTKLKFWKDEYRFNYQPNIFLRKIFFKDIDPKAPAIIYHFYGISPWFKKPWSKGFLRMCKRKKINHWEKDLSIWNDMKNRKGADND